jgi:polysaccharide pyruvyl transferase WcaK-like protein
LRIGFFGNFGTHNLGNECTLFAMLEGARRHLPGADLVAVCYEPVDTARRHRVEACPIWTDPPTGLRLPKALRGLRRLAWEAGDWLRVFRTMRRLDMLVMTGTGMITDANEGITGLPYQMVKWVVSAQLWRRPVKFVSVGAEKLTHPVHSFFLGWSLRRAAYRSYRDPATRQRMGRFVRRAEEDPVYPDLAFSLPESLAAARERPAGPPRVAVGIYAVDHGPAAIETYVGTIGKTLLSLLGQGYLPRIVIGDAQYDAAVLASLRAWLERHQALDRVVEEPVTSFEELMVQLADADLVIATRFHNVLLSLFLGKPVLSLSHMDKNDQLMAAMGLSAHCRSLEGMDEGGVLAMFRALESDAARIRSMIPGKLRQFREELEQQYALVFGDLARSGGQP